MLSSDGFANKEIAQRLNISPKTVAEYLDALCEQFGAANVKQLIAICLRQGIIP